MTGRRAARGAIDDEKVSTPVGEEPTRRSGVDRELPAGSRRGRAEHPDASSVTVEQLLARSGGTVGRRAARRTGEQPRVTGGQPRVTGGQPRVAAEAPPRGPASPVPSLPPVAAFPVEPLVPAVRSGLPPVPGISRPAPAGWEPEERPVRRSGPIPPLPGRIAPAGAGTPGGARAASPNRAAERPPRSRRRRRLLRVVVALAVVVGIGVLYHLGLYFYVDQKIDRVDALATDGPEVLAPRLQAASETYLVVGTGVPGQQGTASVATMLVSVSAVGDRAVLVSVPPTALVDTPECRSADGGLRAPTTEAFAAALLDGGPSCMVRAVQQLSGLRIDHYLGVDLARLPGMIDALGGVPMCVVPTTATQAAAQPLPPGASEVSGEAATGFLQPGDATPDATGTAVADRSQRLLTATLRSALTWSTLADPVTLTRFLTRAADALTVDRSTTLGDLRVLAGSLGDLTGEAVQRATLPVGQAAHVPVGGEQPYVVLDGAGTRTLFDAVIGQTEVPAALLAVDVPAPVAAQEPAEAPPAEPVPAPTGPTVPPGQITLDVLNGTGTTGLAATVADQLRAQGYSVAAVGNESGSVVQSVVRHGPGAAEAARTVAAAVPGSVLEASDGIGDTVQLVIGPGFEAVVAVQLAAPVAEAPPPAEPAVEAQPSPPAAAPVTC